MSKIALVKSLDSYNGVTKSLKMISQEVKSRLKKINKIIIKINFVTTKNELATTPFPSVKAFIDFIKPFYKGRIIIAEEATLGDTTKGFNTFGFSNLTKEKGIKTFDSGKDKSVKISLQRKTINLAKIYTKPSFVVSICRPKTHDTVVVTLSIKNLLIGAIKHGLFKKRFQLPHDKRLNYIMADIADYTFPSLSIIDGTIGMEGNGPANGNPIKSGWVVTGFDALACDSLACYLMGFDIDDVGYLNLMRDKKLGKLYPKDDIKIIGENPVSLVKKFKPHRTFQKQRLWK